MKKHLETIKLAEGENHNIRFLAGRVDAQSLAEGDATKWVTVTRTGTFSDPRYGQFNITHEMLLSMVRNFDANVYGQQIVIDLSHKPQDGAAGFVRKLSIEGNGNSYKLRALVEFTAHGIEAVKKKGFIYLSAEYNENFIDNEHQKEHGPTLLGAALTPRPVIKHLDPVQLSHSAEGELDSGPLLIDQRMIQLLSEETHTVKKLLAELKAKLVAMKLAENLITQLSDAFQSVAEPMATDDLRRELMQNFVAQGEGLVKHLAETGTNPTTIQLSIETPAGAAATGLDADGVKKILAEQIETAAATAKQLSETKQARVDQFTKLLDEADLQGLTEDENKNLSSAADLITAEMTDEQVIALANMQITTGNQIAANKQLAALGYQGPAGTVRISLDESNTIMSLQESISKGLRQSSVFAMGSLTLAAQDKEHPFVTKVLAAFDSLMAPKLHAEHKALAAGATGMGDTTLPAGFQRTVIREALSDLRVLELIQTMTDPGATVTTGIPYESRDTSAIQNGGIVYENQAIHRASVTQAMDYAYILPMKLAFIISNEVMHFTRASSIDWDAYARNVESNARVMRELIVARICNELQRAADAYMAADIANEGLDGQLDGATSTVKTAQFPIVRPHQQRDLQGNTVGSTENPIVVRLDGSAINEYDGTGNQSAGTHYRVTSYNMGYVQFVSELGVPVTPPNAAGADDISYSYATNVAKFDLDNGGTSIEVHLNGLLRTVGARKAVMNADRFINPDFALMSPVLNDTCSNAEMFAAERKRSGTDANSGGDLETVKGINAWGTNAPGVDLGDERIIIGQRGTLAYSIAKPFVTGQPFEAVDGNGNPTGQKQAYGEEYSAIKVPTPIRNRLTSILAYSAGSR